MLHIKCGRVNYDPCTSPKPKGLIGDYAADRRVRIGRPNLAIFRRNLQAKWSTFLGNSGLVQCFANGDQSTLDYIARRLDKLMFEGERPAAAIRLEHDDVAAIRARVVGRWGQAGNGSARPLQTIHQADSGCVHSCIMASCKCALKTSAVRSNSSSKRWSVISMRYF
jgi:hypothetical protein